MFTVLIPARYASTRLPGKPLADIAGKPMVVRVAERAMKSAAARVVVATDNAMVRDACERHGIEVTGPTYLLVDVDATLAPKDASQAGTVEEDARAAIVAFLNPLHGGPGGQGWDLGRGVFLSDVAGALAGVRGIDYVEELRLSVNGVLVENEVPVPPNQIVAPGQIRLKLI